MDDFELENKPDEELNLPQNSGVKKTAMEKPQKTQCEVPDDTTSKQSLKELEQNLNRLINEQNKLVRGDLSKIKKSLEPSDPQEIIMPLELIKKIDDIQKLFIGSETRNKDTERTLQLLTADKKAPSPILFVLAIVLLVPISVFGGVFLQNKMNFMDDSKGWKNHIWTTYGRSLVDCERQFRAKGENGTCSLNINIKN